MRILFLTISYSDEQRISFYEDLLQEFVSNGHNVSVACAVERRTGKETNLKKIRGIDVLQIRTGNLTGNVGLVEKGLSTISIDNCFKKSISRYFQNIDFDLIIYPTPPITLAGTVKYLKNKTGASTYLLLKDIFPQNAVDLGMMSKKGVKGLIYCYFRAKEKQLYQVSDYIGCMSPANVNYLLEHNADIDSAHVEVCPNCVKPIPLNFSEFTKDEVRNKYRIPLDKTVYLYGGNLGKPQGIDFVLDCLEACSQLKDAFFLIIGGGTEAEKIKTFINDHKVPNAMILGALPKDEYEGMVRACDVGLIFLDNRFTIPNFPSRILSYLQSSLAVLVAADHATDMGDIAVSNGFGWKCYSDDIQSFVEAVRESSNCDLRAMGEAGHQYLLENYDVNNGYKIIAKHFENAIL